MSSVELFIMGKVNKWPKCIDLKNILKTFLWEKKRKTYFLLQFFIFSMKVVRVSTGTQKPTHPSKLPGPTWKLVDLMLVTVGSKSPPPKTDLGGSDGEFSSPKPMNPIQSTKPMKEGHIYLDPFRSIDSPVKVW